MTAPKDPTDDLRRSLAQSALVIGRTRPDQQGWPTPCSDFDVAALIGHLVFAAYRVARVGRREVVDGDPTAQRSLAPDEWGPAFSTCAAEALAAWQRPGAFEGDLALPFGTFPAPVVAAIYTLEQVTHAWDLAAALGATELLDPALAEATLPTARQLLPPEGRDLPEMPFDPVVEVPGTAPAYDRLAGYLGRSPAFVPAG
jgi:uncharacterized protein (TIGR03086 family)